jgi:hypothetical protein
MKIYQSRSFEKKIKKMSRPEKDSLDRESGFRAGYDRAS